MAVARREFRPGIADADDRPAIEEILGIALVLDPAAIQETLAVGTAKPRLAAPDRLFRHVHGCLRCGNETARQSSRDFDGSSKARARTMSPIVTRPEFAAGSAVYPSLRGRGVFITGGGSGIGACLVEGFCRQGARVAFIDIDADASARLLQSLQAKGLPVPWYRRCDVCDVHDLQRAIGEAADAFGDFNVLVNNVASDDRHATAEVTPEYWDQRMAVN